MTTWFTSDLHIGHRAVAYERRYGAWPADRSLVTPEDVEWHDEKLAAQWDANVTPEDKVWVLGDLIANPKTLDRALAWIKARPGDKEFVWGNHDPGHPMHSDSQKYDDRYRTAFSSVGMMRKRKINGREVYLSHFPYQDIAVASEEGRFEQFRLPNRGVPILHGHTHASEILTYAHQERFGVPTETKTLQIHVGVDAWGLGPVRLETIAELL